MSDLTPEAVAARSAEVHPRLGLPVTPLVPFAAFGEELGAEVLVKCEHRQRSGSFKARGAMANILGLSEQQRARGVVTASTGNHGLGVGNALATLGGHGTVFVPEQASESKVAALRRYGIQVIAQGNDTGVLEPLARKYAADNGMAYVPPYNDPEVIAGQGTLALEILDQLGDRPLDAIVVAVGGGGLVGGVASVIKTHSPRTVVYGASPVAEAPMAASVRAGAIVPVEPRPTLSDGTAGNVEEGSVTFPLCRDLIDEWVLVEEDRIGAALRMVIDTEHELVEGSAAMAFAAARIRREELAGKRVVVVSCGANISSATLAKALSAE